MKHRFITQNNNKTLYMFFNGWGMDYTLFDNIKLNGDYVIVYDYTNFDIDANIFKSYDSINVIAWSFGVFAASIFISKNTNLPIKFSLAINGTIFPIDDFKGIPESIFRGTLDNLDERNLGKFHRRMCSDSKQFENFTNSHNNNSIDKLKEELVAVLSQYQDNPNNSSWIWDIAIIGDNDKIFSTANQTNGWKDNVAKIIHTSDSHLPQNMESLILKYMLDKSLIKRRFSKILSQYDKEAIYQHKISNELYDIWSKIETVKNPAILEIGCGTGYFTNIYAPKFVPSKLVLNDLCEIPKDYFNFNMPYQFIQGDGELLEFICKNETFDVITSTSTIQWFTNLPKFFWNVSNKLNENGLIVISTFGNQNMKEIKESTKQSLDYYDTNDLKTIIEKDFDILYFKDTIDKLYFDSPLEVLRHIKATGVNSISLSKIWTKGELQKFIQNYKHEDKGCPLTYHPIFIVARLKNKNG